MREPEVHVFASVTEAQHATAVLIADHARQAIAGHGSYTIALAGGKTPLSVYGALAAAPLRDGMPWESWRVIMGDERYVPFDHPDSNYSAARQVLLDHVPIPSEHVYPVPTYYSDPEQAAVIYDRQMAALLRNGRFDCAFLGIGPDGHTASLFPHHPGLHPAAGRLAITIYDSPKPPPLRITLTAELLNMTDMALFLVAGADKAEAVRAILRGPHNPEQYPAQMVRPPQGRTVWLLDAAAARLLNE